MPCYHPLKAYRSRDFNPETGRYGMTFNSTKALIEGSSIQLPCGRCSGCRLERSRQWAIRCLHESQLYSDNCFINLTYDREHLPADYSVQVRPLQLFFKKLRKKLGSHKIRFFACGEYGDINLRPHFHALIFNYTFNDRVVHSISERGDKLYTSKNLSTLWPYGFSTLGDITFESAAYVARYNMKKINGPQAVEHYTRQHPDTKTFHVVNPEFIVMSRRPGIGFAWLQKFKSDVYPDDFVLARGMKMLPPRFYDQQLSEEELQQVKRRRSTGGGAIYEPKALVEKGRKRAANNTPARRAVREQVALARTKTLTRKL